MNNYREIHHPTEPDFQFIQPNAVNHFPHSFEEGSRWDTYGSSSGWTSAISKPAHGEYLERKHFYLDIPVHDTNDLNSYLSEQEANEFIKAFIQTTISPTPQLENHKFNLTNTIRISDFTECKIPTICISLSPTTNTLDNPIYPLRDTCGCCAHTTLEKAIYGALIEAYERQFLLKFWLTKKYTEKITLADAGQALLQSPSHQLFHSLSNCGELSIFNISDTRFPGFCAILCYGNETGSISGVHYCSGMAYAQDITKTLEKATIELWQTYRFMHSFIARNKQITDLSDPYLRHFLECNNYETYIQILSSTAWTIHESNPALLTTKSLITTIRSLKLDGYLYINTTPHKNSRIYFCKYVSPHTFLHMNTSANINTQNRYSEHFSESTDMKQLLKMVPFP